MRHLRRLWKENLFKSQPWVNFIVVNNSWMLANKLTVHMSVMRWAYESVNTFREAYLFFLIFWRCQLFCLNCQYIFNRFTTVIHPHCLSSRCFGFYTVMFVGCSTTWLLLKLSRPSKEVLFLLCFTVLCIVHLYRCFYFVVWYDWLSNTWRRTIFWRHFSPSR